MPVHYKLSKERRRALTDVVARALRFGEPTLFALEGTCRHGLRSNLCLQGWAWLIADLTAAGIVERALHRLGAKRPRWIQGQREYTSEGVTKLEQTHCIQCGRRLAEGRIKFCSKKCAGAYRNEMRDEEQREGERARKFDRALAYRLQSEPRTCERCGCWFKPNYPQQRFCSRTCSGSRSGAEKMNGKAHPWARTGAGGANGAAIYSAKAPMPAGCSAIESARTPTSTASRQPPERRPEPS